MPNPALTLTIQTAKLKREIDGCSNCDLGDYTRDRVHWRGDPSLSKVTLIRPLGNLRSERLRSSLLRRELRHARIKPKEVFDISYTSCYPYTSIARDSVARESCAPNFLAKLQLGGNAIVIITHPKYLGLDVSSKRGVWQYLAGMGWVLVFKATQSQHKIDLGSAFQKCMETGSYPAIPWKYNSFKGYTIEGAATKTRRQLTVGLNKHGWTAVTIEGLRVFVSREDVTRIPMYDVVPISLTDLAMLRSRDAIEAFVNLKQWDEKAKVSIR